MRTRLPARAIVAVLAAGLASGIFAAPDAAAQAVFRTGIDLVNFGVTVVDRKGELVTGLTRDDFVVVEDRKTADNGEMVIALLRGSDVTLKKFYRDPGWMVRLQPANAAMQPIFVDPEQVQIQGVVVGVMRKY